MVVLTEKLPPSVSRFKQGRGGGGDGGGVLTEKLHLSVLRFKRGRDGGGGVSTEKLPLHLAFRVREGVVVVVCRQKNYPCLAFRVREGMVVVVVCQQRNHPLHLTF